MTVGFDLERAVRTRRSVRTFDPSRPLSKETREELTAYADALTNPLGPAPRLILLDRDTAAGGEKLGTYGVIRGAKLYLGAAISRDEHAQEALGYQLEQLVLYAAARGIGTCWIGGTFNRGAFASAMGIGSDELFPIITPLGYAAEKQSVMERIFRGRTTADRRAPWETLFFDGDFSRPLTRESAGILSCAFELMRLAPSAVNKQPWRVVRADGAYHFYEAVSLPATPPIDLQRVDLGIGICHFHLAALEAGVTGQFAAAAHPQPPERTVYLTSYLPD